MSRSNGWNFSAGFSYGGLLYSKLMKYYDGYILGYSADSIGGATIFDVCAGEANFGFEAIKAGAKKVFAIENNPKMIAQIKKKKSCHTMFDALEIVPRDAYSGVITELAQENPPRIIHFKRCLYGGEENVVNVLRESYEALENDGSIFVIHPEKNNRMYDDNGFGGIAFDHWVKRQINKLGALFKNHSHQRYSKDELEKICRKACPPSIPFFLPNSRPAYHFIVIKK